MYMMVRVDRARLPGFKSDLEIVERLVAEESVFCLPGKCFNYPNYMRIVLTLPSALLSEACDRILEFCSRRLIVPPPSRLVNLLVEHKSLYATYGKVHGRFVDNQTDNWHSTWQLAVTLAEAISKKKEVDLDEVVATIRRKESVSDLYNRDMLSGRKMSIIEGQTRKMSMVDDETRKT